MLAVLLQGRLCCFAKKLGDNARLATLAPQAQAECLRACAELGCSNLIPLSFWCDGVPYKWDKSQSFEFMNLPEWVNPWQRHEHGEWTGQGRFKRAGQGHDLRAALILAKAEWKAFKEIVSVLGWQGHEGICWLCQAILKDTQTKNSAKRLALDHWGFFHRRIDDYKKPVSTLLAAPALRVHQFRPDWLHAMDQGCAADFLGNFGRRYPNLIATTKHKDFDLTCF